MADRVIFAINVTPIETVTQAVTYSNIEDSANHATVTDNSHDVVATEIAKTFGGSGESVTLAGYAGAANLQGYSNRASNYVDASNSASGTKVTNAARANDFVFIKNTGFKFSFTTAFGDATTDCILVAAKLPAFASSSADGRSTAGGSGEIQFIELAFLAPGEAIALKLGASNKSVTQFGGTSGDLISLNSSEALLFVKTVESDGTEASDGNAVEFLCLT